MDIFTIGLIVFLIGAIVVFGGYTFYRRNIEPGDGEHDRSV